MTAAGGARSTTQTLVELCRRAELVVSDVQADRGEVQCLHHRWPEPIAVAADAAALADALVLARNDVDDLWPGRDADDGALALVSTALEAAIDSRHTAPRRIDFVGSRWQVTPPDQPPRRGSTADGAHWVAPPRRGRPE